MAPQAYWELKSKHRLLLEDVFSVNECPGYMMDHFTEIVEGKI